MPIISINDRNGVYRSVSPKIYLLSCFDAHIFSVRTRFSLETLCQLPPFLKKLLRALAHKCCLDSIYAETARMDLFDAGPQKVQLSSLSLIGVLLISIFHSF